MIDIAKKKLPSAVVGILLYISYCAMSWYMMRGTLAYYCERYGMTGWLANDIFAFFLGGIIPFAVYEILAQFIFRTLTIKVGTGALNVKYGLELSLIAANILLFGLKFIFFACPLYAVIINTIIDPTVTIAAVALFLYYGFKKGYVDKSLYKTVVNDVLGAFLVVYGILSAVNIILTAV